MTAWGPKLSYFESIIYHSSDLIRSRTILERYLRNNNLSINKLDQRKGNLMTTKLNKYNIIEWTSFIYPRLLNTLTNNINSWWENNLGRPRRKLESYDGGGNNRSPKRGSRKRSGCQEEYIHHGDNLKYHLYIPSSQHTCNFHSTITNLFSPFSFKSPFSISWKLIIMEINSSLRILIENIP